jgi:hypothetical protein
MTLDEKLAISIKAGELWRSGDTEGYSLLMRTAPMPPYLAKVAKKTMGAEFLIKNGFNLSEAEAEFGKDWINT